MKQERTRQAIHEGTAIDEQLRMFRIEVADSELVELHNRLTGVRWAPEPVGGADGYGFRGLPSRIWSSTGETATTGAPGRPGSTSTRSSPPPSTGPTCTF